jgi:hypothetical protein
MEATPPELEEYLRSGQARRLGACRSTAGAGKSVADLFALLDLMNAPSPEHACNLAKDPGQLRALQSSSRMSTLRVCPWQNEENGPPVF